MNTSFLTLILNAKRLMQDQVMLNYNVLKELLSYMFFTDHFVPLIYRLGCLVVLLAAIILTFSVVFDLTQFGDVEKNPGPNLGL